MLPRTLILALIGTAFLPACTPTPTPGGGAPVTGCGFAAQQGAIGLTMDCTVTGGLPNMLIDPVNSANTGCGLASLSLFGQTVNVPIRVIYGENGDENNGRVRLGAMIPQAAGNALATHGGSLAKAAVPNCNGITGPTVPVTTSFGGRHIAIVDKSQNPMCVFESRLDLAPYNQSIGPGLGLNLDVSGITRTAVRNALARRLDLELARAVNRLLLPAANTNAAGFVGRGGRCLNDYREFVGT